MSSDEEHVILSYARRGAFTNVKRRPWGWVVLIVVALGIGLALVVSFARSADPQASGWLVDSDVPGSELFHNDHNFGRMPVRLEPAVLKQLGMSSSDSFDKDVYGEGFYFGSGLEPASEFTLRVPDAAAPAYVEIATTFGRRTRLYTLHYNGYNKTIKLLAYKKNGIDLRISVPDRVAPGGALNISVTATNIGNCSIGGSKARLFTFIGTSTTPPDLRRCSDHESQLLDERLAPHEVKNEQVVLTAPTVAGDYYIGAILCLLDPNSDEISVGSWPSNTMIIRVRGQSPK